MTGAALEVLREFTRFGLVGFGGPSAHLALFRGRFVTELGWLTEQEFLDLLGAANLLPGPTSTEVALAIGMSRAGLPGLLLAGAGFILPAAIVVLAIAVAYVQFGSSPVIGWLLYGIQPVVVAVVAIAVAGLARTALRGPLTWAIALGAAAALLLGVDPLVVIVVGALVGLAAGGADRLAGLRDRASSVAFAVPGVAAPVTAAGLASFFVLFLKVGLLSFGSGYVLVAFLRQALVVPGMLADRQLLDAIAVGQVTPGPVYTAATFIGYLLYGLPGAVVATIAIFIPAFVGVAVVHRFIARLRASPLAAGLLDGVNAASLGLMAAVTVQLAATTVRDPVTAALGIGAFIVLLRDPRMTVPLMLAGGAIGVAVHAAGLVSG